MEFKKASCVLLTLNVNIITCGEFIKPIAVVFFDLLPLTSEVDFNKVFRSLACLFCEIFVQFFRTVMSLPEHTNLTWLAAKQSQS